MKFFTVIILDEEEKALLTDMISIQDWLDNAVHNKARQCIDIIIEEVTDKKAEKVPVDEKLLIVKDAVVKTAVERQAEFEASLPK